MKKPPVRMCIACRNAYEKKQMLRIVKDKEGNISLDFTWKKAGRGAYICDNAQCIEKCVKNKLLNRAFEQDISAEVYDAIKEQYSHKQD
ncbi:MAG: YlxR family protein [Clostridia bacterium]|nr:YlxR family protein [Clostridia bacterium]MDE7079237.1 YlxR family protein [Clostridia bacterium]